MFTLKLFRRVNGQLVIKILAVDHIHSIDIMDDTEGTPDQHPATDMIELKAYFGTNECDYKTFFIGYLTDEQRVGRTLIDWHGSEDNSVWGWAVLENQAGNTTQHFRPASYG